MHRFLLYSCFFAVLGCTQTEDFSSLYEHGVSWDLAAYRSNTLQNISYDILLQIPESKEERITGISTFNFTLKPSDSTQVIIDFNQPPSSVLSVSQKGQPVPHEIINNHIVITSLEPGTHAIEIAFRAGESSLNRNDEFLYTLFVPDRASFSIPLFDQPNLKARYRLTLETPATWTAVANGPVKERITLGNIVKHRFEETAPISTYLFSFAAGLFQTETAERNGRIMTMYHRETDSKKVDRNRDAVFDLHFESLKWLEEYTAIDYPFDKFDFVLIPSFQYGGMEHPGAILYRASSLFLEASATQNQYLGRASLIAHETAHMWFGDLVTMNWFDDVWTKEVFANFLAAKIANPTFPEINHDLRFLLRHYPSAYSIDRTAGANPIQQPLENLQMAGTLYGAIIYQKAPIVMRQLELLIGEDLMQRGLQMYLRTYSFSNATWEDLIAILDGLSPIDVRSWSRSWINEPGRPLIETTVSHEGDAAPFIHIKQTDTGKKNRIWNQNLNLMLGYADSTQYIPIQFDAPSVDIALPNGSPLPDFILPNGMGIGYGQFSLDPQSRTYLLDHLPDLSDPLTRGIAWITLWDEVLDANISPSEFYEQVLESLPQESNELNIQRILNYLTTTYWRLLSAQQREIYAPSFESFLWNQVNNSPSTSLKSTYFNAFRNTVLTREGTERLLAIWNESLAIEGLTLSEQDFTSMALELAIRLEAQAVDIMATQQERITNPDRKARFSFIKSAVSADQAERDAFFDSLTQLENRSHEPWVLAALRLLHHPLRAESSVQYLRPSLELLEEIQQTGDIFFPQRWLSSTLDGHQSVEAANIVQEFLDANPGYPYRLKNKILQSSDGLFRASEINTGN